MYVKTIKWGFTGSAAVTFPYYTLDRNVFSLLQYLFLII